MGSRGNFRTLPSWIKQSQHYSASSFPCCPHNDLKIETTGFILTLKVMEISSVLHDCMPKPRFVRIDQRDAFCWWHCSICIYSGSPYIDTLTALPMRAKSSPLQVKCHGPVSQPHIQIISLIHLPGFHHRKQLFSRFTRVRVFIKISRSTEHTLQKLGSDSYYLTRNVDKSYIFIFLNLTAI